MKEHQEPVSDEAILNDENEELFEELCNKLENVIPQELFETIKSVRPLEYAISLLLELGGRIALDFPNIKLDKPYEIPEEAALINDEQDGYSFTLAKTPFIAIAGGFRARENVDETVIESCDLEGMFPLLMSKDGNTIHVFLYNSNDQTLLIPITAPVNLNIDASGTPEEDQEKLEQGLQSLVDHLEDIKNDPPAASSWANNLEEEQAVKEWAQRNALTIMPTIQLSMDIYH